MTSAEIISLIDRQIDAFNRHDVEAFVACYHSNALLKDIDGGIRAQGREAMVDLYKDIFLKAPHIRVDLINRMASGAFVIDLERVSGHPSSADRESAIVYQVTNNQIMTVWFVR
jgi:hypothetical protein